MFAESFKDNDQMARAVITGITRIAKESLFSEMNNLAVYSVMSGGYDAVFGFTEDEMHTVLEEFDLIEQEGLIRNWYDGFSIGNMTKIYNPWSVISSGALAAAFFEISDVVLVIPGGPAFAHI